MMSPSCRVTVGWLLLQDRGKDQAAVRYSLWCVVGGLMFYRCIVLNQYAESLQCSGLLFHVCSCVSLFTLCSILMVCIFHCIKLIAFIQLST